jgi:hypothetical protein
MKALVVFLTTAVLLCGVLLAHNSLAQPPVNYICSGPYPGCGFDQCVPIGGTCPDDSDNPGAPYNYASYSSVSVYSCNPWPNNNCNPNAFDNPYCSVIAYNTLLMPPNNCINATCFFVERVGQCQNPP